MQCTGFNYELNLRVIFKKNRAMHGFQLWIKFKYSAGFFFSGSGPNLGSYFWVGPAQIDSLTKILTLNPLTLEEHEESQKKIR